MHKVSPVRGISGSNRQSTKSSPKSYMAIGIDVSNTLLNQFVYYYTCVFACFFIDIYQIITIHAW